MQWHITCSTYIALKLVNKSQVHTDRCVTDRLPLVLTNILEFNPHEL